MKYKEDLQQLAWEKYKLNKRIRLRSKFTDPKYPKDMIEFHKKDIEASKLQIQILTLEIDFIKDNYEDLLHDPEAKFCQCNWDLYCHVHKAEFENFEI